MKRRTFLLRAVGAAAVVGGAYWLKDQVLWPAPKLAFGAEGSGWLDFAVRNTTVPTVEIELGGRKVTALLDTGAQYSVIDRGLVDELGLGDRFDLPLIAYGVGGEPQTGKGVSLDIRIGALDVPRLRAAILDLGPLASAEGLGAQLVLGQDLFSACVMELDLKARRMRLSDPASFAPSSDMMEAEVRLKGTALTTEITLEGAVVQAVVDTGFSGLIALSTSAATTAGLLDGRDETSGTGIVLGGMAKARIVRAETLTFDNQLRRGVQVQVFEDSPLPNYPQALLGMEMFEGLKIALDLGRGRLFQSGELDLTIG